MELIEILEDRDLLVEPIRGNLSRAYRILCRPHGRRNRARDSRAARRRCRRAVRVTLASGARLRVDPWTAWDVC